ncbi:MAG: cytochrome b [Maritimibacter sp.]
MIANTPARFGLLSRAIHWVMAVGIIALLALGTYIDNMTPGLSNLWLFGLHKSLGLSMLLLAVFRIIWHRVSPPPAPLPAPRWQEVAAKTAHHLLYALLLLVPLSGWIGAAATGIDVSLWGVTLPPIAPVSEAWDKTAFVAHGILTKLLFIVLLVHIAGALKRRDGTLKRMVSG